MHWYLVFMRLCVIRIYSVVHITQSLLPSDTSFAFHFSFTEASVALSTEQFRHRFNQGSTIYTKPLSSKVDLPFFSLNLSVLMTDVLLLIFFVLCDFTHCSVDGKAFSILYFWTFILVICICAKLHPVICTLGTHQSPLIKLWKKISDTLLSHTKNSAISIVSVNFIFTNKYLKLGIGSFLVQILSQILSTWVMIMFPRIQKLMKKRKVPLNPFSFSNDVLQKEDTT